MSGNPSTDGPLPDGYVRKEDADAWIDAHLDAYAREYDIPRDCLHVLIQRLGEHDDGTPILGIHPIILWSKVVARN